MNSTTWTRTSSRHRTSPSLTPPHQPSPQTPSQSAARRPPPSAQAGTSLHNRPPPPTSRSRTSPRRSSKQTQPVVSFLRSWALTTRRLHSHSPQQQPSEQRRTQPEPHCSSPQDSKHPPPCDLATPVSHRSFLTAVSGTLVSVRLHLSPSSPSSPLRRPTVLHSPSLRSAQARQPLQPRLCSP